MVTFQDITKKNKRCMKSVTPEAQYAEVSFQCNTLFVLLTLQVIYQGQAEHDATFENS